MKYRIGQLNDPRPDDPYFDTELEAVEAACNFDRILVTTVGVWDSYGELLAIVHEGQPFYP